MAHFSEDGKLGEYFADFAHAHADLFLVFLDKDADRPGFDDVQAVAEVAGIADSVTKTV